MFLEHFSIMKQKTEHLAAFSDALKGLIQDRNKLDNAAKFMYC